MSNHDIKPREMIRRVRLIGMAPNQRSSEPNVRQKKANGIQQSTIVLPYCNNIFSNRIAMIQFFVICICVERVPQQRYRGISLKLSLSR